MFLTGWSHHRIEVPESLESKFGMFARKDERRRIDGMLMFISGNLVTKQLQLQVAGCVLFYLVEQATRSRFIKNKWEESNERCCRAARSQHREKTMGGVQNRRSISTRLR